MVNEKPDRSNTIAVDELEIIELGDSKRIEKIDAGDEKYFGLGLGIVHDTMENMRQTMKEIWNGLGWKDRVNVHTKHCQHLTNNVPTC